MSKKLKYLLIKKAIKLSKNKRYYEPTTECINNIFKELVRNYKKI